jgi:transcriptional regulator with XRE-family HTH domain
MKIGEKIRLIRRTLDISQGELGRRTKIKREYISKLETGDLKNPTFLTISKIAKALGIESPKALFTNVDFL